MAEIIPPSIQPRTPEPSLAEFEDNDHHRSTPRSQIPEDIIHHLETLSSQLESALGLSRSLQAQQASAQNTIHLLELKVTELQQLVQTKVHDQHEAHQAAIKEAIESVRRYRDFGATSPCVGGISATDFDATLEALAKSLD